jgi:hypothetical protein
MSVCDNGSVRSLSPDAVNVWLGPIAPPGTMARWPNARCGTAPVRALLNLVVVVTGSGNNDNKIAAALGAERGIGGESPVGFLLCGKGRRRVSLYGWRFQLVDNVGR